MDDEPDVTHENPQTPRNADERALPSRHEHSAEEQEGSSGGPEVNAGHQRNGHLPGHAGTDADRPATEPVQLGESSFSDDDTPLEGFDPRILALIQQSQHLHFPVQLPEAESLAALKHGDPQAYDLWMSAIAKRIDHDMWMEQAPLKQPYLIARQGQWFGLVGLLIMAGITVTAILYGHAWLAGLFGILDFVGVIAAFTQGNSGGSGEND